MKIACVLITHFCLKSEMYRDPHQKQQPLLIVKTQASHRVVVDFSPGLTGVQYGMPLQKAVAFAPTARLVESDEAYYESEFSKILEALAQRSPVVEEAALGCAYVALDGLEELYGGDERLVLALQSAAPAHFHARVGVGTGKFIAYLAAISAKPGSVFKAPSGSQRFLKSFPVNVLPVSFKLKARLREFGLHTLGDIASLPAGALQAQFGPEGKTIWKLANGLDDSPLIPRKFEEVISESLSFAAPLATFEAILVGVEVLLARAFRRPELKGRYVRTITLEGQVYRRAAWTKRIPFREPVGEVRQAMLRIKASLENTAFPGPLEDLTLTLKGFTGQTGRQGSLFTDVRKHEQLQQAIMQLDTVLGKPSPIFRIREVEPWSRIPERRYALAPFAR